MVIGLTKLLKMKKQNFIAIVCALMLCVLMIASDYYGYTTEVAVAEFKDEVFKKSFTPSWESFIIPLSIIIIAFLHNSKK